MFDKWLDSLVTLIHAAKHIRHDKSAVHEIALARHRLACAIAGTQYYPFPVDEKF